LVYKQPYRRTEVHTAYPTQSGNNGIFFELWVVLILQWWYSIHNCLAHQL